MLVVGVVSGSPSYIGFEALKFFDFLKFFSSKFVTFVSNTPDFVKFFEELLQGSEEFFTEVMEIVEEAAVEFDRAVTDVLTPFMEIFVEIDSAIEETAHPLVQTINPLFQDHPLCIGCRHYHGQAYGGTFLVCGMHPYGMDKDITACPDKELISWMSPPSS
jgi:hypothetical protein